MIPGPRDTGLRIRGRDWMSEFSNKPTAFRKGLKIVGYNILILLLMSLMVEGCIRLTNPDIKPLATDSVFVKDDVYGNSSGLTPGATGSSMGQQFTVTDNGFWRYTLPGNSSPEQMTAEWLFLGDSVTMGMGVEPDSTFAGLLSTRGMDSLLVLNPSLIGYSSRDYVNILEALAGSNEHRIKRVTVFWCLNDAYSGATTGENPVGIRQFVPAITLFIYRHVRTYQWLKKQLFDRPRAYYEFDKSLYESEYEAFDTTLEDIVLIKEYAGRMGARLEFVLLPYEYQFRSSNRVPQRKMASVLESLQISYVDAARPMSDNIRAGNLQDATAYYLYGDGIHFSVKGHRTISDIVANME